MKAKKLALLAVTAVALAVPFTASAALSNPVDTTLVQNNKGQAVTGFPKSFTSLPSATSFTTDITSTTLGSKWSVSDTLKNLSTTSFSAVVKFTVAGWYDTFAASAYVTPKAGYTSKVTSVSLYNETTHQYLTAIPGGNAPYNFTGLKKGDVYDWTVNGTTNAPKYNSMTTTFTVAAVPEPEEWAMMLVGVGLVSYQVRRKQKRMSQRALSV